MEGIKRMEKHDSTYQISQLPTSRLWLFLLLFLVSFQSQAQSARSFETPSPEQSLRSTSLSAMQFDAYSDRALEKVEEWLTYMSLLQDSRQDTLLYRELSGYVADLFLDPRVALIYDESPIVLEKWLAANRSYHGDQIFVSRHEWIDSWAHTKGNFERHLMLNLAVLEGESPAWAGERVISVYLTRIEKDFGGEKLETWEIRLGGME